MGLWDRVRGWMSKDEPEAGPESEPERASGDGRGEAEAASSAASLAPREGTRGASEASARKGVAAELERLSSLALGRIAGDEALAILRSVRGTVAELEAVARVTKALGGRSGFDELRVACADILALRGDEDGALRMVEGTSSIPGLMLAADLYAARGQLPRAVVTIERVLARDLDAPGAMERFRRLRASLGAAPAFVRRLDESTALAAVPTEHAFRLLREVARGGAGVVYEAEDELLGRRVAFKVYHGRGEDQPALLREVAVADALAGAGVVRVFDADPAAGWVAFEWAPRGSLREALRAPTAGDLWPIRGWAEPLARSLARVHAAGYVHGDVKPANVLLRRTGEPMLSDFGIARKQGEASEGGSPGYVSPERLAGAPIAATDDVYGFGRILEDAVLRLEALPGAPPEAELRGWREVALFCVAELEVRPRSGRELLEFFPEP